MNKIIKALKKPKIAIINIMNLKFFRLLPDKIFIKIEYYLVMNKKLNLDNPKTFNEKLQWLKINDRKDIYTKIVDKYEVREYISQKIGEEYLIPLIGVWDEFDEIDFSKLPNKFVLKPTHTSGNVFICKDKSKIDYKDLKRKVNKWMKRRYYWVHREWPYKNVKPRIICEEYISDKDSTPDDYKVMCFNSKAKLIEVHIDRFKNHNLDIYDNEWNRVALAEDGPSSNNVYEKPKEFDKMIKMSEKLSSISCHARIDWYIVNGKLYFGEITLYEASGLDQFNNPEDDCTLGEWINLYN
ncbi:MULTISPECIES: ATP-grasp fold amidoligase family protein [Clostridium]|uniref:Glycosyl transferase n=1 Tax=Clostridium paraputrificum TaxID=29363 RepID=A0A1B8RS38_9CLOT|nr:MULTISPECIES: ATP-grasp fold amidoligase family protein [Clostridium]MDB2103260.1 ATP-grasp fold amidoligase family protein [Clostridium paraputrificum]MDB2124213.1 ATP-grasp fold amidoligase family protein [Clostridium paraputrificum]MDC0801325.1 ATP-grasp fold amidoligase family protein [Clostridium paraputrificum]MDU1585104.1 ATP-grasp fold amidoligase family protein [Clostridium sp.]MDU6521007.1 ATP-grasp fold amidoligase family protein [Clostridium sp.]